MNRLGKLGKLGVIKILAALTLALCAAGCGDDGNPASGGGMAVGNHFNPDIEYMEFTDSRDNKTYKYVRIGGTDWMAENLNYNTRDGNGSWCYNKPDHFRDVDCELFGRFYDWPTAMDIDPQYLVRSWNGSDENHQGVCPAGWRLPNHRDWGGLIKATGDPRSAGTKLKAAASESKYKWYGEPTDEFGFSALPAAYRNDDGWYYYLKYFAYWWTSTQYDYTNALYYYMSYQFSGVEDNYDRSKSYGYNVRCVRGG